MSGTLVFFEIGYLIGVVLFLICQRQGLIRKWSASLGLLTKIKAGAAY